MRHQGNDIYKISLNDREIELSKSEIMSILMEFLKSRSHSEDISIIWHGYVDNLSDAYKEMLIEDLLGELGRPIDVQYYLELRNRRKYHKKENIVKLFNQYYDSTKTKKEVFVRIAEELSITVKAVEKAYYSK